MGLPKIPSYELPLASEIPVARAKWAFEPDRAALLIHDMQNYFINAFEPDVSPIAPVIKNIARLRDACRAAGIPVYYTAQNGNQDRRDRGLQADLWGPGMTDAPEHQHVTEALKPAHGDTVLVKHRYSAFQLSNLEHLMRVRGRNQIIICGIYAHIGCLLTAAEAFQRDIYPFMVADAVADFSRENHDMALSYLAKTSGIPMPLETLLAKIQG
ncbi:isochorismatase family protein [Phyllobacterium sp. YR531]|uniref:isochorismatase family protein n=1 Tax=Phyllobacterium sp. YR531 TaxID=1144343 RepID=UPI00026F5BBB|nr:isochorismatase family protein [Phyllobacterium sp. YR531]EJN00008.1 isochorismate hydrolase [Phyllobacterium sp. YR531]